jgi:uncharacterized membrane protein
MIAGGVAILLRRTGKLGAAACGVIYFIFAVFWLPRLYTAPHLLGHRIGIYIGVLAGVAQQLILVAAAMIVYAAAAAPGSASPWKVALVARWIFGLCSINFGMGHLTGVQVTASFIPKWVPLAGSFWAIFTGICFVLAGLAILSRILGVLAARLLTLMLLVFSALVLVPMVLATPRDHVAWGGNAYNLAAVGAAWIFASSIANRNARQE